MEIVDSCQNNNGGCSHRCEHTTVGPRCSCNDGYILALDGKTCTGNLHPSKGDAQQSCRSRTSLPLPSLPSSCRISAVLWHFSATAPACLALCLLRSFIRRGGSSASQMEEGTGAIARVMAMSPCVQLRLRGWFLSLPLAGWLCLGASGPLFRSVPCANPAVCYGSCSVSITCSMVRLHIWLWAVSLRKWKQ